ncbi:MAG: hypothetical protein HYV13_03650 [Candidatus Doudnabacteria bacterium]|nr:hypothetical protein [Candidatus Doudnabacteria bacterium]
MRFRGSDILKLLLLTVGVAGLMVAAVTAPGLFTALGPFHQKRYKPRQIKRAFDYARQSEIIKLEKTSSGYKVMLTEKGQRRLQQFRLGELHLPQPKKWDGRWRMVMFDVPEQYHERRAVFSRKLKELGMYQMQKSVWVWPYDLRDEVDLLKEAYEIRPFVRIATAASLDRQTDLLKFFKLD